MRGCSFLTPKVVRLWRVRAFLNPAVERNSTFRGLFSDDEYRSVDTYFAGHPHLVPSPLIQLPELAARLGVDGIDAKDESGRFGLNAFKIAGVRYAMHRLGDDASARRRVCDGGQPRTRGGARGAATRRRPARSSSRGRTITGRRARTRTARIAAMKGDGATVVEVDGTYEDAVRAARYAARPARRSSPTRRGPATRRSRAGSWPDTRRSSKRPRRSGTHAGRHHLSGRRRRARVRGGELVRLAVRRGASLLDRLRTRRRGMPARVGRAGKPAHARGPARDDHGRPALRGAIPAAWPAIARGVDAFVTVRMTSSCSTRWSGSRSRPAERDRRGPVRRVRRRRARRRRRAPELAHVRARCRMDRSTHALVIVTEGP